jgi:hypothetical protein
VRGSAGPGRSGLLVASALLVTVALFVAAVVATGLVACGVSGCEGGGFGAVYAPTKAQVGLLAAGLTLVPVACWALRTRRWTLRLPAMVAVVVLGAALAMLVLGLGPDGCPTGQTRATAGPESFHPGALTCSADRDALPRR